MKVTEVMKVQITYSELATSVYKLCRHIDRSGDI